MGKNAFSHESGIHQDGMLKNVETYEIMRPEDVGVNATSLMLGKLSGRHAFRDKLETMGYVLEDDAFEDAFRRFKDLADKKKHVFDEDIAALVDDEIMRGQDAISIKALRVESGTGISPVASLTLSVEGEVKASPPRATARWTPFSWPSARLYPHTATLAAVPDQRRDRGHRRPGHRSACGWRKTAAPSPARRRTPTPWWRRPMPM